MRERSNNGFRSSILQDDTESKKRGERKKFANRMEKKTAERFGGRKQPGSGSFEFNKGDVKTDRVLFDDKFTDKLSFSLKQEDLVKLCEEAKGEGGRVPVMKILFRSPVEEMKWLPKEWAVVPADFLRELLERAGDDD